MFSALKKILKAIIDGIKFYQMVLKDPQTPLVSKALLWIAIGYLFSPIDLIPDFIPVLGQCDDLIIVPALVFLAMLFVPEQVVVRCGHENGFNREDV